MKKLIRFELPRDPAMIAYGLGIDPEATLGPRLFSWVAWSFTLVYWFGVLRGNWPYLTLAIVATVVSIGTTAWLVNVRRALRARQERAVTMELAWSTSQRIPIEGYLSCWIRSSRSVFDVILKTAGHEQRIVDEIRGLDARIITSFEPQRVRVELPRKDYDRGIEGNRATIPDVDLMKEVVMSVVTPLVDELGIERIEMGTL